jgi:hypothetical protein
MNPRRLLLVCALLAAAGFGVRPDAAHGCAAAYRHNEPFAIASESAIILWDEKSQTEHFIRRAAFNTEAKDFGFLVPTPTKPLLAEADDAAFAELARVTAPKIVEQKRPAGGGGGCGIGCAAAPGSKAAGAPEAGVEVLEKNKVSGFDYAILKATDADELSKWLKDNGYDFSDPLKAWAAHYIQEKWLITAFKISKGPDGKTAATKAVRMTFQTPKPFFPYREPEAKKPAEQHPASRLLRVYFLSTGKMQGKLGDSAWPGETKWANKIETPDRDKVLDLLKLPKDTPPAEWWLTEFEDHSDPRPGTADVFFGPAENNNPVERPPHIKYVGAEWSGCVMTYALVAFLVLPGLARRLVGRTGRK